MKTAIVLGASGLVGSQLLQLLLKSKEYSKVVVFVRTKIELYDNKLIQYSIDFNTINFYKQYIKGDDFFCCIGTTIKKAGTRENFRKVDLTYPVEFARIAKDNGVNTFLLISSIGADYNSKNYYLKTKGILEEKIKEINFSTTFIFRPCILLGNRKELRIAEKVGGTMISLFSFLLVGRMKKYKPVQSIQLAKAMYKIAQSKLLDTHIYEFNEIQEFS